MATLNSKEGAYPTVTGFLAKIFQEYSPSVGLPRAIERCQQISWLQLRQTKRSVAQARPLPFRAAPIASTITYRCPRVNPVSHCMNIVPHLHYSLVNNVSPRGRLYPHSYQWMLYPIQYSLVNTACIPYNIVFRAAEAI